MVKLFKRITGGLKNLPLSLLGFVLLYGCLMIIPTIAYLRDQRMENTAWAVFFATGIYIFRKINKLAGTIIMYLAFISILSFVYAMDVFMVIFAFIILYVGIVAMYGDLKKRKDAIYDFLIVIVFVNVFFQIMQYFHIFFISYPVPGMEDMRCGLMNNINDLSALYAVCVPAFMRKRRWFLLPIVLFGLFMASTLNGVFATFIILTIYTIRKFKSGPVAFVTIVLAFSLVSFYAMKVEKFDYANQKNGRMYIWEKTIQVASIKKLGWGINQYDKVMPLLTSFKFINPQTRQDLYNQIYDKVNFDKALRKVSNNDIGYFNGDDLSHVAFLQAHNEFLEWYFIAGPFGFLIGFLFLFILLWRSAKQRDNIPFYGLLASCITAFFFFSWHIVPTATIAILYIGLIDGERKHQKQIRADNSLYDHGR